MLVCWIDTKTLQSFDSILLVERINTVWHKCLFSLTYDLFSNKKKALQSLNVWLVIFKAQLNLFLIIRHDGMVS